jgi:hypothetical protein
LDILGAVVAVSLCVLDRPQGDSKAAAEPEEPVGPDLTLYLLNVIREEVGCQCPRRVLSCG